MKKRYNSIIGILCIVLIVLCIYSIIFLFIDAEPIGSTYYNTYTLQAIAWRNNRTFLIDDYPSLELALFKGRYYVSFPPLPSVVLYFLTFIFMENTPDNFLVKLYMLISCILIYKILRKKQYNNLQSVIFAILFCFASSGLYISINGAVWFHAQTLAFLCVTVAIYFFSIKKINSALVFIALSVACRPFNILYYLIILYYCICNKTISKNEFFKKCKKIIPGIVISAAIGGLLAYYNYMRFQNIFEFGHNYLPEFSTQGGIQFSITHIMYNINNYICALPFEIVNNSIQFKRFGFSLLIANPIILIMLGRFTISLLKRNLKKENFFIIIVFFVHLVLLLMHRTFGGYQYGARYAVDLIPYALLYIIQDEYVQLRKYEFVILFIGLIMAIWGSCTLLLPVM